MRRGFLVCFLLNLTVLASCGLLGHDLSEDVHFLTQKAPASGVMQALYEGTVIADGECLRLGGIPERHTVVWPYGFHLGGPGAHYVYSNRGIVLGRIGGEFKLGGGEVPTLWENGPVEEDVRQLALTTCPGRYWLVGEF